MNYTPEQIAEIVLKVLKEVNAPNLSLEEKLELAKHPNTSVELLKVLATDKKWDVRYWVAKHLNTPEETLKVLATDENIAVHCGVAANPNYKVLNEVNTPNLSLLKKLELSQHPNTSVEILKVLATDENFNVRYWVSRNPNTPVEILKVLATDENWNVRYWIAQHPNYKIKNLELTSIQYDALKTLLKSSQVEALKNLTL